MNSILIESVLFIIQLAVIFYVSRIFGKLFARLKLPSFAGELFAGLVIGHVVLDKIQMPGYSWFYIFVLFAIMIFIFSFSLNSNIFLNLHYTKTGFFIGAGSFIVSFFAGFFSGLVIIPDSVFTWLFLGLICAVSSSSIAVGLLSRNNKISSPEGLAIISASLFNYLLGITGFALITIIFLFTGMVKGRFNPVAGVALSLITGAYITGLVLSKTRHVSKIQNSIFNINNFLLTLLIALTGMMADFRVMFNSGSLVFSAVFIFIVIFFKIAGSSLPSLYLGFNMRISLNIGIGMISQGELALIIAFLGLYWGVLGQNIFGIIILMIFVTAIISSPLLHLSFKQSKELHKKTPENDDMLRFITMDCISVSLKGETKTEIITELVDLLNIQGKLQDHELALKDIFLRENIMSTGMQHGIALPHAKSDGVDSMVVALGIKKQGIDFESSDGLKSHIFILVISPRTSNGTHVKFLSSISAVLKNEKLCKKLINSESPENVVRLFKNSGMV